MQRNTNFRPINSNTFQYTPRPSNHFQPKNSQLIPIRSNTLQDLLSQVGPNFSTHVKRHQNSFQRSSVLTLRSQLQMPKCPTSIQPEDRDPGPPFPDDFVCRVCSKPDAAVGYKPPRLSAANGYWSSTCANGKNHHIAWWVCKFDAPDACSWVP